MMQELYSIKDVLVGFSQPFPMQNEAVALRAFVGSVQSSTPNVCNTNPEHKQLWRVGSFDDQTGKFISDLKLIADAGSYWRPTEVKPEVKDAASN